MALDLYTGMANFDGFEIAGGTDSIAVNAAAGMMGESTNMAFSEQSRGENVAPMSTSVEAGVGASR